MKEHARKPALWAQRVFSDDGTYGATVIRYADGDMEVLPVSSGTSRGKVSENDAEPWAHEVAERYFARKAVDVAERRMRDAITAYQRALEECR